MRIRRAIALLGATGLLFTACAEDPTMGETETPVVSAVDAGVLAEGMVDEPPIRISSPLLEYPPLLLDAGIEGRVLLAAIVGVDGAVEEGSVELLDASRPEFVGPAMAVLAQASFRPARLAGALVRVRIEVPFAFSIMRGAR